MIPFVVYHAILFVIDLLLLRGIVKHPPTTVLRFLNLAEQGFLAAVLLGFVFGRGNLNVPVHALAWHGSFFLFGSALLIFRQKIEGRRRKIFPGLIFGFTLIFFALSVQSLLIEPFALQARHHRIETSKIDKPIKIVFITDLQTDRIGRYERRTLRRVKAENADLILWGGDYLQASRKAREVRLSRQLRELLLETDIDPPLGFYAVRGNQENSRWTPWLSMFQGTTVRPMSRTQSRDAGEIRITFLSVEDSFQAVKFRDPGAKDRFRIVVGHAPNFAVHGQEADLLLAGHTHGGQVWIPGYGPALCLIPSLMNRIVPRVPRQMMRGLVTLSDGGELIVSTGTGLERGRAPRIRFLCRPDYWVIHLVPKPAEATETEEEAVQRQ